ncbi:hypothetical protein C942_04106 [Photobacterium marinum]|uniref:Uncharacterized protein n=1 Tax=Photobacterium marinum TaxID=1056511 RepID=L8J6J0_9GAMM|nr:hypothetical protein [Photobacterium marinum]ELR63092.1 hypothetical protein C942_04106 [Photobacterium marinum]
MTEKSFLIEYGASIIAVSASLLTAIVTLSFNWLNKRTDHAFQEKQDAIKREVEFKNNYVIEPIMTFIKKDIIMAQAVYAKGSSGDESIEIDCSTQAENLYIASLAASISPDMAEKIRLYGHEKISLNTCALASSKDDGKDLDKAYKCLLKLEQYASQIIEDLCTHCSGVREKT